VRGSGSFFLLRHPSRDTDAQCIESIAFGRSYLDRKRGVQTFGFTIIKKESRFGASQVWDCQYKLGQATAYEAMDACIELADKYGIGQISVDHAFHYLWGGGYVMEAAKKGYIAYTNCTACNYRSGSLHGEQSDFGYESPFLGLSHH